MASIGRSRVVLGPNDLMKTSFRRCAETALGIDRIRKPQSGEIHRFILLS